MYKRAEKKLEQEMDVVYLLRQLRQFKLLMQVLTTINHRSLVKYSLKNVLNNEKTEKPKPLLG